MFYFNVNIEFFECNIYTGLTQSSDELVETLDDVAVPLPPAHNQIQRFENLRMQPITNRHQLHQSSNGTFYRTADSKSSAQKVKEQLVDQFDRLYKKLRNELLDYGESEKALDRKDCVDEANNKRSDGDTWSYNQCSTCTCKVGYL